MAPLSFLLLVTQGNCFKLWHIMDSEALADNQILHSGCSWDSHFFVLCVTCVQNNFYIQTWIKQLMTKYFFQGIAPNFTYSQNCIFKSINGSFQINYFNPKNFMVGTYQEYPSLFLPVLSPWALHILIVCHHWCQV